MVGDRSIGLGHSISGLVDHEKDKDSRMSVGDLCHNRLSPVFHGPQHVIVKEKCHGCQDTVDLMETESLLYM